MFRNVSVYLACDQIQNRVPNLTGSRSVCSNRPCSNAKRILRCAQSDSSQEGPISELRGENQRERLQDQSPADVKTKGGRVRTIAIFAPSSCKEARASDSLREILEHEQTSERADQKGLCSKWVGLDLGNSFEHHESLEGQKHCQVCIIGVSLLSAWPRGGEYKETESVKIVQTEPNLQAYIDLLKWCYSLDRTTTTPGHISPEGGWKTNQLHSSTHRHAGIFAFSPTFEGFLCPPRFCTSPPRLRYDRWYTR